MKNRISNPLILLFLLILGNSCRSQASVLKSNQDMQSFERIGIPISKMLFDSLVKKHIQILENRKSENKIEDYLEMIRLYNTISWGNISDQYSKQFHADFIIRMGDAIKALNARTSKGMGYYSKEYNVYIGGKPHQNSQYLIVSK